MLSRIQLICELVRAAILRPNYLNGFVSSFSAQAELFGKKCKNGNALDVAKKHVISDEFLSQFASDFDELSTDEIASVVKFYNSEAMKKYMKVSMPMGKSLYKAMEEVFAETEKNL